MPLKAYSTRSNFPFGIQADGFASSCPRQTENKPKRTVVSTSLLIIVIESFQ